MKKVIMNKLYSTESARAVGYHQYLNPSDCHWYRETLYRKRTGEYFLHGEGGAMSLYGKKVGQNEWTGGETIMPLAYERARDWAEKHLDADDYQEEFGTVSEGDERTVLSVSIEAGLADRIRREAQEKGLTVSALIASKF
jgi:hypothetical protein